MDLLPSSEQEEIISSVRAVLTDNYTVGEPLTNELLNAASAQGWAGLALHETAGGVGYTVVERSAPVSGAGPLLRTWEFPRCLAWGSDRSRSWPVSHFRAQSWKGLPAYGARLNASARRSSPSRIR